MHGAERLWATTREPQEDKLAILPYAEKLEDPDVINMLRAYWDAALDVYETRPDRELDHERLAALRADFLAKYDIEESDVDRGSFNGQLHPEVEGYNWYRGYQITLKGTPQHRLESVYILAGWLQPWKEGGAPYPIAFVDKGFSPDTARQMIADYCEWQVAILRLY